MKTTIKDIASRAGVSTTTVSLVLNNKPSRISDITRNHILEIARQLDYSPNSIAVSLVTKKSHTIGLILPNIRESFYSALTHSIETFSSKNKYGVFLCNTDQSIQKTSYYIESMQTGYVDGFIIIPPSDVNVGENNAVIRAALKNSKIPYVVLGHQIKEFEHDFITLDNEAGGYMAAKHLIDLGHRKIGCITGPQYETEANLRLKGYRRALEECHIPYDEANIRGGDYFYDSGFTGAQSLIEEHVSAIFACNDIMAIGALNAAAQAGRSVPKDFSVIGFDNNPVLKDLNIPLTTIEQPYGAIGKKATEVLFEKIDDQLTQCCNYYFTPSLVNRNSTAKV